MPYQAAGAMARGTAGMGGNGRGDGLSALDAVADAGGPWRDRLTEDQDLGLRLIAAGWKGRARQELRAVVEQQGLPGLWALVSPTHALVPGKPPGDGAYGRGAAGAGGPAGPP